MSELPHDLRDFPGADGLVRSNVVHGTFHVAGWGGRRGVGLRGRFDQEVAVCGERVYCLVNRSRGGGCSGSSHRGGVK